MRDIEYKCCHAFQGGYSFKRSNSEVVAEDGKVKLYLHGNLIAHKDLFSDKVVVSSSGWLTNTTKSRLNALLDYGSYGCYIYQQNFAWYVALTNSEIKIPFEDNMELPPKILEMPKQISKLHGNIVNLLT